MTHRGNAARSEPLARGSLRLNFGPSKGILLGRYVTALQVAVSPALQPLLSPRGDIERYRRVSVSEDSLSTAIDSVIVDGTSVAIARDVGLLVANI